MTFETTEQTTLNEPEKVCADALAELFLGETGRPGAARTEAVSVDESLPQDSGAAQAEAHAGSARAEPAAAAPSAPSASAAAAADDAIAIEVVLAGHLPVMASAWVSQYARGLAAGGRPVGLIRAAGGRLSVEMFGDGAERPRQAPATALEAVRQLRQQTDRWVIQADGASAGELIDRGAADRLTLLCSPDEAALVAGYRMVKDLLEPRVELAAPLGALHIAIAGRADAEAMAAAERLSRAAERFLGIETTVAVGAARIETGASASWFEGEAPAPGLLAELAGAIDDAAEDRVEADAAPGAELRSESGASPGSESSPQNAVAPWAHAMAGPGFFIETELAAGNGSHQTAAARDPEPHERAEPDPPPAPGPLSGRAVQPEAAAFSLQCPRAPGIEFRVEDGTIVAIADARSLGLDLALRRLVVASAWAAEHDALITQATGHSGRVAQRVLLVEDAPAARHLLDADIRVRVAASGRGEIPLN